MTILYVMTFGLFSGFSAVFALLLNNQFGGDPTPRPPPPRGRLAPPMRSQKMPQDMRMIEPMRGGPLWPFIPGVGMAITLAGIASAWRAGMIIGICLKVPALPKPENRNMVTVFLGCAIFCALCSVLCWVMYARKNAPFPG